MNFFACIDCEVVGACAAVASVAVGYGFWHRVSSYLRRLKNVFRR